MNERIVELAKQAGFEFWDDEPWNPGDIIDWAGRYDNEFIKFSKLIIEQCARLCIQDLADPRDTPEGLCASKIVEYFGVGS